MKEFYFNKFLAWHEKRFLDYIYPKFREGYHEIWVESRKDEERAASAKNIKKKLSKEAYEALHQIRDTVTLNRVFRSNSSRDYDYFGQFRNKYHEIHIEQAHLIMGLLEQYNEYLMKIDLLKGIYESYLYKYIQKTKLIFDVNFMYEYKYKKYILEIRGFFHYNKRINEFAIYIIIAIIAYVIILYLYFYVTLKPYFELLNNSSIIQNKYFLTKLSEFYKGALYNDNILIKTMNKISFINKLRFLALRQQFKILAEISEIKLINKKK